MSVKEAYELFRNFIKNNLEPLMTISEYDTVFFVSNCAPKDFKQDCYLIDKATKSISSIDFLECIEFTKEKGEEKHIVYRIQDGKIVEQFIDDPSTY